MTSIFFLAGLWKLNLLKIQVHYLFFSNSLNKTILYILARGLHNLILFNSFNKFSTGRSIKPTLIWYPLFIIIMFYLTRSINSVRVDLLNLHLLSSIYYYNVLFLYNFYNKLERVIILLLFMSSNVTMISHSFSVIIPSLGSWSRRANTFSATTLRSWPCGSTTSLKDRIKCRNFYKMSKNCIYLHILTFPIYNIPLKLKLSNK